uniref:Uncharacterized protein n=1 Tax=Romanomermis culicivorax TaxID=13658 RepID=A0A915I2W3_ROMCU
MDQHAFFKHFLAIPIYGFGFGKNDGSHNSVSLNRNIPKECGYTTNNLCKLNTKLLVKGLLDASTMLSKI